MSLPPPCSTVCADINTETRMTSSYVQPNIHKLHDINSTRQLFFFSWALNFAWVCGSVPLLSGPPDSTLTVRQRSRKMAVIHFVPCHRQGSFFPSAHYLQTRLRISAGHRSLPLWPRPTVLQGVGVSGRPTLDSVGTTRNHPGHSTLVPLIQNKLTLLMQLSHLEIFLE